MRPQVAAMTRFGLFVTLFRLVSSSSKGQVPPPPGGDDRPKLGTTECENCETSRCYQDCLARQRRRTAVAQEEMRDRCENDACSECQSMECYKRCYEEQRDRAESLYEQLEEARGRVDQAESNYAEAGVVLAETKEQVKFVGMQERAVGLLSICHENLMDTCSLCETNEDCEYPELCYEVIKDYYFNENDACNHYAGGCHCKIVMK